MPSTHTGTSSAVPTEHIATDLLGLGRIGLAPADELPVIELPATVDGRESTIELRHLRTADPEHFEGSGAPAGYDYVVRGFEGSETALVAAMNCRNAADVALIEILERFDIEVATRE